MLKRLQLLTLLVAISLATFAQDWIEVNSGLSDGLGIGQISIGMNDQDALWASAIASDGMIYDAFTRSTDGGQTWTAGSFNAGTGLSQLFAIDANTCWAVFNTGANQGLYKTEDGGSTWVKKGTAYGSGSFANVIHFFNDNDGFAQGDPLGGYYELYTTSDGGETWTRVPEGNIPDPTSGEYGITGNYSAVGNSIWFGTNKGRVFYSTDKGMSWDVTLLPFGNTNVVQPLFRTENVGIAFRSYLDMGIEPELNVTTDGGETWSSLLVSGDMYARWFEYIPGSSSAWLGSSSEPGSEGISYTLDDGANWNDLTVGVPVQAPEFLDNQTGWAGTWVDGGSGGILIYNGAPIGGGGGAEIVEDFEAYNAGEKLVEQALAAGIDYWTCWSGDGGAGSAEDPMVSADQAYMGANSVLCEGTNDFVLNFDDKTAGKYAVDFQMYVPSGYVGYYNLLQAWNPGGSGTTWGLEVYFNPGGIAEVTAEGTTGIEVFNYNYDEWIHVENIIDLNNDEGTLMVNGEEILVWEWSVGASGGGLNQLAAMNIYAAATNGTPNFFVDDIQVIELEPPVGPAAINVDPASFEVSLETGQMGTEELTIMNDGIATLNWNAFVQFPFMAKETATTHTRSAKPEAEFKFSEIPATQMINGAGQAYPNSNDDVVILNYDGENASGVGLTNGGGFEFGARFTTDMTGMYIGMEVTEIDVYVYDVVTASTVKIYGHGTQASPGVLLAEQDFNATPSAWNTVVLDEPVTITGGDLWVTCYVEHDAGLFVAGNDGGPHVENGDWFKSGASWVPMHVANPSIDANWNIRAQAEGEPMESWLTLDPVSGSTPGGDSDMLTLMLDASGMANGTYTANVVINSNDPDTPQVLVPVTLQVSGGSGLEPPTDLNATVEDNDVMLTWTAPGGGGGTIEELVYDNGTSTGAYSYEGYTMATHMSPAGACQLLTMKYYTTTQAGANDFNANVFEWAGSQPGTTVIYEENVTAVNEDWMEVDVSGENITFDGDFVVGFGSVNGTTFLGYDTDLNNGRSWDFDNVSAWSPWSEAYLIRAVVQYTDGTIAEIGPIAEPQTPAIKTVGTTHPTDYSGVNTVKPIDNVADAKALIGYNVYRNGDVIAEEITDTEYTDMNLMAGTYTYYVTAVYDEGESGPSNNQTVEIGGTAGTVAELDFEDQADFSLTFDPWTAVDVDMVTTYGFTGITFPNAYEPMAYIAFNPDQTDPPMSDDPEIQPHGGDRFGACMASTAAPWNDDWMISPQVQLGSNSLINLWVKSYTADYGLERYNIGVSTTGMDPEDFTIISGSPYEEAPVEWTEVSYDLSAYDGQMVYVGIQCVSQDAFVFMIDDIEITSTVGVEEVNASQFNVYPNPAQDVVNINSSITLKSVTIVNYTGQVVYQAPVSGTDAQINTADLSAGIYVIQLETENGVSSRKLIIE